MLAFIISLLLAAGAGYLFLLWWAKSPQEKLKSIIKDLENNKVDTTFFKNIEKEVSDGTPEAIKKQKEAINKTIKTTKAKSKLSKDEQADLETMTKLQTTLQSVENKEDFAKSTWGMWDYGYSGGVALVTFLLSFLLLRMLFSTTKTNNE